MVITLGRMTEQEPVPPRAAAASSDGGKRLSEDVAVASAAPRDGEAAHLTDPDAVDTSIRTPGQRSRTFAGILVNTAAANITTSYLWFALTFWVYLETRNVIATGVARTCC
jgi:MFS transporter, DHA3 family, multidrug efflux protein